MTKRRPQPNPDMPDDPKVLAEAIFREAERRKRRLKEQAERRKSRPAD